MPESTRVPDSSMESSINPFATAAMALQAAPPAPVARMVSAAVCGMALAAVAYACFAPIDVVVSAQGRVVPAGRVKTVQPSEGGVLRAVAVRDGQHVHQGDVLVELDPTASEADIERIQREWWQAAADVPRLQAQLQGVPNPSVPAGTPAELAASQRAQLASKLTEQASRLASLDAEVARRRADRDALAEGIARLGESLPLVRRKHAMREELATTGHIAQASVIETRLEVMSAERELAVQRDRLAESSAALNAAVQQRALAVAEFRARTEGELAEALRRRDASAQELVKARQRREMQVLRAPIDGVVQQLAISTVGGVVTPAQLLMAIVPERMPLEVEAQVLNRDVGRLKAGQRAVVKVETFDFTRYGPIQGEVQWVGNDAVADPKLGPVYPVRLRLAALHTPRAVDGEHGTLVPGMAVTADVRTDERRLIEYFLSPLLRYRQESLRER